MTQTLGAAIRARRTELGMTREDLAARIDGGMRQVDISRLELDQVTLPCQERLECVARALGLPVGELFELAGWTGTNAAFSAPAASPEETRPERPASSREQTAAQRDNRQVWGAD